MSKVLGISLQDDEYVTFFKEIDMGHRKKIQGYFALFCFVVGCIPPMFFIMWPLAAFIFYKRKYPDENTPVGFVITNKRFVQIHYNEAKYPNFSIDTNNIADIDCQRHSIHSRGRSRNLIGILISALIGWIFTKGRDHFKNKIPKTSEEHWSSVRFLIITLTDKTTHKITFNKNEEGQLLGRKLGSILSIGVESGWDSLLRSNTSYPQSRTVSLL